ncbi:MAG TPA: enoyl-[acyl-carrier-protein] reductase FabK [Mesotoga sp.]|nr:enoyl-[acyl-carrier-protein] reductase FabK [Mesotoga infera]HNS67471.1 enoyl-[acyl-carrier-protein] reductase FabK [Mesotoga infera]HOI34651.1 enoyl-[acyl-carrier-protein] reductase FabK [Mesotoga infera]HON26840.1 enoyl-[acyl-carrier-protein] reductase FabK [Mesotoga infera]HQQ56832.1 enoyl-[acyl-carrier-protein] reductase FabK [Mesotoga sp.]
MIAAGKKLIELLDIEFPIIQGGMAWIADHSLASAVSNAGGLGVIAAGNLDPEELREEIIRTRRLTDKPFGVNIMLLSPQAGKLVEVVCEEKVPVVTTGAGNPGPFMERFKCHGIKVLPVVASAGLARRMEKFGADAVIAEGMEAGGHIGKVTTMTLVPVVVDTVTIPVVAAGGIGDGRGLAAAFALGASGVQIGTRFICTFECTAHAKYKERILNSSELDPVVTGSSTGHPVRSLRNGLTRRIEELEREGAGFEEIEKIAVGALKKASREGDVNNGSVMAGQVCGIIKEINTVEEVIGELVEEARKTIDSLGGKGLW